MPIQNLLQANSFDFDVNIGLKGDINFNQTANVKLVRDGSNIKAEVSADLYGETLKVTYTDGCYLYCIRQFESESGFQ